jgi:RHH-type proline utilization regulon transcriptional repressor/proline dehydrogenase/delta 1-pyrroline-5-carboxylate dehydrogenase
VNCLRKWPALRDAAAAQAELTSWWHDYGSLARDEAALSVEVNVQRYRRTLAPIVVRIDESFGEVSASFIGAVSSITGADVTLSAARDVHAASKVTVESADELVQRAGLIARVRWLSGEPAPVVALLERGVSTDRRPLAQSGAVEGPRWLAEQSVAMTRHRYGNVNAGPKPDCRGLGELAR